MIAVFVPSSRHFLIWAREYPEIAGGALNRTRLRTEKCIAILDPRQMAGICFDRVIRVGELSPEMERAAEICELRIRSRQNTVPPPVPPGITKVDNQTLGAMLLCAFRYTLGRMTYQTSLTRMWMEKYWHLLSPWHAQIHRDIQSAIERGNAGMHCDIEEWERILTLPVASSRD